MYSYFKNLFQQVDPRTQLLSAAPCTGSHETIYNQPEEGKRELTVHSKSGILNNAEKQSTLTVSHSSNNMEEKSSYAQENNNPTLAPTEHEIVPATVPCIEYVPDSSAATNPETCVIHSNTSPPNASSTSSYAGDIDTEEITREFCRPPDSTTKETFLTQNSIDNSDSGTGMIYLRETNYQGSKGPVVVKFESTLHETDEVTEGFIGDLKEPEESGFNTDTSGHYVTNAPLHCCST